MASKKFWNTASEVGKLWSVAIKRTHMDRTSLPTAIYGRKRDRTSGEISRFPSAKESDISRFGTHFRPHTDGTFYRVGPQQWQESARDC